MKIAENVVIVKCPCCDKEIAFKVDVFGKVGKVYGGSKFTDFPNKAWIEEMLDEKKI